MKHTVVLLFFSAEVVDGDDSEKESEEDERAMRELYEAIGYAEGEVYDFPREVGIMLCCSGMVSVIFVT